MDLTKTHFIIIDDNFFDCRIAQKVIQNIGNAASISIFQNAEDALTHIKSSSPQLNEEYKTVLLVDIQMPIMDGFAFVTEFEQIPENIKAHYSFNFVTSSINENDIRRSERFPSVRKFLNKPLTGADVINILSSL